ncbi:MAG TPA: TlpA disulfide reductase family protein [Pyrinomonadaceae bacterium]
MSFAPTRLCAPPRRRAPRLLLRLAPVFCLLALSGCGEAPRYARSEVGTATPEATRSTATLPRTNLPMPPIASSHGAATQAPGWTLLDGRRESLADYQGRVLVLDLYATYCPPCRDEIPQLISLQRRYEARGLKVIGLNVGGDDDRRLVPDYVRELGIDYALGNPDDELINTLSGGETAIPRTYVFDRRGRLADFSVGYDNEVAARLEQAVQKAVASDE